MLDEAGFVGVVAVNSELEVARYLRPGDVLRNVQILEDVSREKQTALGTGYFVTTRQRYETGDGEHVGDLLFRILKFKPGTGTTSKASEGEGERQSSRPLTAPAPASRHQPRQPGPLRRLPRRTSCASALQRLRPDVLPAVAALLRVRVVRHRLPVASGRGDALLLHVAVHHPQVPGLPLPARRRAGRARGGRAASSPTSSASRRDRSRSACRSRSSGSTATPRWSRARPTRVARSPSRSSARRRRRDAARHRGGHGVSEGDRLPTWACP